MFNFPFYPFYRRNYMSPYGYANYPYNNLKRIMPTCTTQKEKATANQKKSAEPKPTDSKDEDILFEIFGIKLYSDDILLMGLLFFLYTEKVDDQYLFIALIMLLLS